MLKEKVGSLEKTVSELMIKLNIFEDELNKIKKDKVITEQIDIKAQNSEEKDYTSKDAAFKDNNIKKVSKMKKTLWNVNKVKLRPEKQRNRCLYLGLKQGSLCWREGNLKQ